MCGHHSDGERFSFYRHRFSKNPIRFFWHHAKFLSFFLLVQINRQKCVVNEENLSDSEEVLEKSRPIHTVPDKKHSNLLKFCQILDRIYIYIYN